MKKIVALILSIILFTVSSWIFLTVAGMGDQLTVEGLMVSIIPGVILGVFLWKNYYKDESTFSKSRFFILITILIVVLILMFPFLGYTVEFIF